MEATENKTNTQSENSVDSSRNENAPARLRRLKIQQNILQKGIKHLYSKLLEYDSSIGNNILCGDNDHIILLYFEKIKKMFTEIKNLYEEIRFLTDETNKGNSSDINEIRKNILLLETKIKEFKKYMQSELETLGKEEITLNDQQNQIINRKVKSPTITIPNKIIAPSPVKVLIQSPFKCLEVQQFQEFMKHNKRFGGWNEYDHNQFIQIWNAYYTSDLNISQGIDINSEMCDHLIQDLMNKIIGTNREDIISHIQWYTQYLKLYACQKNAVQKWKENRNKIKKYNKGNHQNEKRVKSTRRNVKAKPQQSTSISSDDSLFLDVLASSEKSSEDIEDKDKIQKMAPYKSRLMEPTKQWLYRCNNENDARAACNIETVKKLSIPAWRIGLQN